MFLRMIAPLFGALLMAASANAAVLNTTNWSFNKGAVKTRGGTATNAAKVGDTITFYDVLGDGTTNWTLTLTDLVNQRSNSEILINRGAENLAAAPFVYQAKHNASRNGFVMATHVTSSFVNAADGSAVTLKNVRFRVNDLDGGGPTANLTDFVASADATSFGVATTPEKTRLIVEDDAYAGTGGKIVYAQRTGPDGWKGLPNTTNDPNYDAYMQFASLNSASFVLGAIFPRGINIASQRGIGIYSAEYDGVFTPGIPGTPTPAPVPLPAAGLLMIGGLGALGALKRRARK